MMVCEELQCDWSKVRPQYASANRDAREMAPEWTLNVLGNGGTDPNGGGEPDVRQSRPHGRDRHSGQPLSAHADQRRVVGEGRPLLFAARGSRGARAIAAGRGEAVERAGRGALGEGQRDHSFARAIARRPTARSRTSLRKRRIRIPREITIKPPDAVDVDGHRAEESRRADEGDGRDRLRRSTCELPGMKWAAVKSCPVYGGDVKSYDFDAVRTVPGVRSAVRFPIPDPALTRGRVFSGGVAVIADHWYQAEDRSRANADRVGDPGAARRRSTRRTCVRRSLAALDEPGRVRVDQGDVDAALRAAPRRSSRRRTRRRICRARAWSPATRRARHRRSRRHLVRRSEPAGDALQRVADHRHPASRTCTFICAISAAASAATATGRRPSRRS